MTTAGKAPDPAPQVHQVDTDPATGAKTLHLQDPITLGGQEVRSIKFRRPFARDFRAVFTKKNVEEHSMQVLLLIMAARISDTTDAELDGLSMADTIKVLEVVDSFQQGAPVTS